MNFRTSKVAGYIVLAVLSSSTASLSAPALPASAAQDSEIAPRARARQAAAQARQIFQRGRSELAPGASIVVIDHGQQVVMGNYGFADLEHSSPITGETVFHVASIAKQFTAYAVLLLEDDGKLSRKDSVRRYVPELPAYADAITIEHLIHHASGLRDHFGVMNLAGWRSDDVVDETDVHRIIMAQRGTNATPGSAYEYSNTNYFLLGLIVERVSGRDFPDFLNDRVFAPLKMTRSRVRALAGELTPGAAKAYQRGVDGRYHRDYLQFGYFGDTNLQTTAADLALWGDFVMTSQSAGVPLHQRLAELAPLAGGSHNDYAWGLEVGKVGPYATLQHGGSDASFGAYTLFVPERRVAVVVTANSREVSPSKVASSIARSYLGIADAPAKVKRKSGSPAALASALKRFSGTYRFENGLVFTLVDVDGQPRIDTYGLGTVTPEFEAPATFVARGASVTFREASSPTAEVRMDGAVLTGPRVDAQATAISPSALNREFDCADLLATFRIVTDGEGWVLQSGSGDPIDLVPLGPTEFVIETPGGGIGSVASNGEATQLRLKTFRGGDFVCPAR